MSDAQRFPPHERNLLLRTPGLGEVIVQRLEVAGIVSLMQLHALGSDQVLDRVGQGWWHNRRRALSRALESSARLGPGNAAPSGAVLAAASEGKPASRTAGRGRPG